MWSKPWSYKEGLTIGTGLLIIGILLQMTVGAINWDLFACPVNVIVLVVYIIALIVMHLLRKRVYLFSWLSHYSAAVSALLWVVGMTVVMGLIRQAPSGHAPNASTDLLGFSQMIASWPFVLLYFWMVTALGLTNPSRQKYSSLTMRHIPLCFWQKNIDLEEHTMDRNETTRSVCSCCGATIETDDYYTFDGNILCDECYHSETVTCEHCGDRIWADDNAGSDSMPLCNSCYDDYYTTCECCGRIIHRDYASYITPTATVATRNVRTVLFTNTTTSPNRYFTASQSAISAWNLKSTRVVRTATMLIRFWVSANLMMYDYRYFRRDWWNVPEPCENEPQDVRQLKDFASSIGVSREDIDLLLSYGYFVEEIEEMLYQPGVIEEVLCEILSECAYDYCGEF